MFPDWAHTSNIGEQINQIKKLEYTYPSLSAWKACEHRGLLVLEIQQPSSCVLPEQESRLRTWLSVFPTVFPTSPKLLLADSSIPRGSSSESEAGRSISNPSLSACVAQSWEEWGNSGLFFLKAFDEAWIVLTVYIDVIHAFMFYVVWLKTSVIFYLVNASLSTQSSIILLYFFLWENVLRYQNYESLDNLLHYSDKLLLNLERQQQPMTSKLKFNKPISKQNITNVYHLYLLIL